MFLLKLNSINIDSFFLILKFINKIYRSNIEYLSYFIFLYAILDMHFLQINILIKKFVLSYITTFQMRVCPSNYVRFMPLKIFLTIKIKFHVNIARVNSIQFELSQCFREWIVDVIASYYVVF